MPQDVVGTDDEWLIASDVALRLKLSEQTLANQRAQGRGPKFFKLGEGRFAPVRYRRSDVEEWARSRPRRTA